MGVAAYKCNQCGAPLIFSPNAGKLVCEYCKNEQEVNTDSDKNEVSENQIEQFVQYSCSSCGGEIVTTDTTAATFCYYCHSPVVLSDRLGGEFTPDQVIPFKIDKKEAIEGFLKWTKTKKYIPQDFFSKSQIEKLTGIYFPYWTAECVADGSMKALGTQVDTWRSGDRDYTRRCEYEVSRKGQVKCDLFLRNGSTKKDKHFADKVQPYEYSEVTSFDSKYLSGFQAEKRNIEWSNHEPGVKEVAHEILHSELGNSISSYHSLQGKEMTLHNLRMSSNYVLLPVWVLTYRGKDGKIYYYAMNGQTGKTCGELPIDNSRLRKNMLINIGIAFLVLLGGFYLC